MNWEAIGAVGEVAGAIAVIATLVYLAAQIRQNTRSVEAAAFDSTSSFIMSTRQSMAENTELAEIYFEGCRDHDSLDEKHKLRFRLLMHNIFWAFGNNYRQAQISDASGEDLAPLTAALERILSTPGARWFWEEYKQEFYPSFRSEVERVLESVERATPSETVTGSRAARP